MEKSAKDNVKFESAKQIEDLLNDFKQEDYPMVDNYER